ncbi:death-on-curing protein [Mycoplasma sp. NEAQ87857]|uniref:Fic family protein n=1 Tax=Mycoplasma sp. NEAQ87857 TaxID=2683967 RepID=UPI0013197671|nr:Fic family protein [Mycoplasma sp. NEAQ87857]QGZ97342.1 death-on-curing protein [Mycoplasma sp. NEAQ87857]
MNQKYYVHLAKKHFAELVFNTAYIEGVDVTLSQTQTIIDQGSVENVSNSDIQTVLNLKDAWKYMIKNVDQDLTLEYICKINQFVSRNESLDWGVLRYGNIGISGTNYKPNIPNKEDVINQIDKLNQIPDQKLKALKFFGYIVRNQLFWDGNKRTATIIAAKVLIQNGLGILTIGKSNALNFNESLLNYYNTNDDSMLLECLNNCIKTE